MYLVSVLRMGRPTIRQEVENTALGMAVHRLAQEYPAASIMSSPKREKPKDGRKAADLMRPHGRVV